jgi:hypothetical protein
VRLALDQLFESIRARVPTATEAQVARFKHAYFAELAMGLEHLVRQALLPAHSDRLEEPCACREGADEAGRQNVTSTSTVSVGEPYIPSFDPLPGAHGPPGPTPTAIEGLKKRGIWVEEDDAAPSPPPRRQDPEPAGPAPAAIAALKQRGMWQEDVVPAIDSNVPARPTPAATSSSHRPSQAEVLASQHATVAELQAATGCTAEIAAEVIARRPGHAKAQLALARLKTPAKQTAVVTGEPAPAGTTLPRGYEPAGAARCDCCGRDRPLNRSGFCPDCTKRGSRKWNKGRSKFNALPRKTH